MDKEELIQLIKNTNILMQQYSLNGESIIEEVHRASDELNNTLSDTQQNVRKLFNQSTDEVKNLTKNAVDDALKEQTEEYEKRLKLALTKIEDSIHDLYQERKKIASQTKILSWKAIIGVATGMAIMLIASFVMTWNEKEKRDVIIAEYKTVKAQTHALNAEDRMIKTQCGDRLCIKIDTEAGKWGNNGEYAIPILK